MDSCLLLAGLLYRLKGSIFFVNLQIWREINGFIPSLGRIALQVKGIHFLCNLEIGGVMDSCLVWISLSVKGIHFPCYLQSGDREMDSCHVLAGSL